MAFPLEFSPRMQRATIIVSIVTVAGLWAIFRRNKSKREEEEAPEAAPVAPPPPPWHTHTAGLRDHLDAQLALRLDLEGDLLVDEEGTIVAQRQAMLAALQAAPGGLVALAERCGGGPLDCLMVAHWALRVYEGVMREHVRRLQLHALVIAAMPGW